MDKEFQCRICEYFYPIRHKRKHGGKIVCTECYRELEEVLV